MNAAAPQGLNEWARWQVISLGVGLGGLTLCAVGGLLSPAQFFRSYLVAYIFWTGIALGSLAILMVQYLTGGAWGIISRRTLESATSTIPLMALLFVPLFLGMHSLYSWTHAAAIAADPHLEHKRIYLNRTFFIVRWVIYFSVWMVTARLLNRWSLAQDRTADPRLALRLQNLSGPGLFVLAITLTFAMIDWVMSLERDWYSAIYGVVFLAGVVLAAFAFVISVVVFLSKYPPLSGIIRPNHFHDLGNLLLTFVMLWAYCAFSQFLIIWSGNLQEETPWYVRRLQHGWGWIGGSLIVFHFFVPFFLLLSAELKRRPRLLGAVAAVILLMRFIDVVWLVIPAFPQSPLSNWVDVLAHATSAILALIGLGGVWLWMFSRRLGANALLPLHDPYLEEALGYEKEQ